MKTGIPEFDLNLYIGILKRRKFAALAAGLIILTAFALTGLLWKTKYQASSTVLIAKEAIMDTLIKNVGVGGSLDDRLKNLTDNLTSREMLERLIDRLHLERVEGKPVPKSTQVMRIRERLRITVKRDKDNDQFTIAYEAADPEAAALLVNTLIEEFIARNSNYGTGEAERAFEFLGGQLTEYKAKLESYNKQLQKFEVAHPGVFPQTKEATYARVTELQQLRTDTEFKLNELLAKKQNLADQLSGGNGAEDAPPDSPQGRLDTLLAQLANLSAKYTDDYPDVQRVKSEIEELQKQLKAGGKRSENPAFNKLKSELRRTASEIELMRSRTKELSAQIKEQRRSAGIRGGSEEIERIQREREIYQKTYDELLQKHEAARLTRDLARSAKAANFIVEPATLPLYPSQPDRFMILLGGLIGALAAGIGLAFGIEHLDKSIKSETALSEDFGLNVMASIPKITTKEARMAQQRFNRRIFTAAGVYVFFFGIMLANEVLAKFAGLRVFDF